MIRPARASDAAAVAAVYEPFVRDTVVSFETEPPSAEDVLARMRSGYPWLVAEEAGAVVGYAYGSVHRSRPAYRWSVEVSVYLAAGVQGRGLGSALYAELLPLLGELGYATALAGITLPNEASVRLHQRAGFRPLGVFPRVGWKHGAWHDTGWFAREIRTRPGVPVAPLPWELQD